MNQANKLKARYFTLAFASAFLVLAVITMFVVIFLKPVRADPNRYEAEKPVKNDYVPQQADNLSLLTLGIKAPKDPAAAYILVSFHPTDSRIAVVSIPQQTVVDWEGEQLTLREISEKKGAQGVKNALSSHLSIPIDRYAKVDASSFVAAANFVGTVEFTMPFDMVYSDETFSVNIAAGKQLLDGRDVVNIFMYPNYEQGELGRMQLMSDLTTAIINQRIDVSLSTIVPEIFKSVINLMDTDISSADFEIRKEAVKYLARKGKDITQTIRMDGQFYEDNAKFEIAQTTKAEIQQEFGSLQTK